MNRRNFYSAVVFGAILVFFVGIVAVTFDYEKMSVSVQDKTDPTKWEKYMSEKISFQNYLPPLR